MKDRPAAAPRRNPAVAPERDATRTVTPTRQPTVRGDSDRGVKVDSQRAVDRGGVIRRDGDGRRFRSDGDGRRFSGRDWGERRFFCRDRHDHRRVIVVYPYWTGWWWYAGPPRFYYYDTWYGTYSSPSYNTYDDSAYRTYYDYGYGWGQGLSKRESSWEDFVAYLRSYIVEAASSSVTEFRRGFVAGYGTGGEDAFDAGMDEANAATG